MNPPFRIAGVDEVGRGPLAGPVVAASAVFERDNPGLGSFSDSKSLSERKRDELFPQIIQQALDWAIVGIGPRTIDEINIRQATHLAMKVAIESVSADFAHIDGNMKVETSLPQKTIIKGDALDPIIGAASILAKVWRDRCMKIYDEIYPEYGFQKHKGYPSKAHQAALWHHGATAIHRFSFRTVREVEEGRLPDLLTSTGDIFILSKSRRSDPQSEFPIQAHSEATRAVG